MRVPTFAMKVYDLQWFTTFAMSYDEAAEALAGDGIDTVLTQNRIDPLPNSGVDQRDYLSRFGDHLSSYRDAAWVDALRRRGLRVLQTSAVLFDPAALERYPDARPIDANGESARAVDWYVGICPTHEAYLDEKLSKLDRVAEELAPDGLFLQFIRFPGFWENWTCSPDYAFSNADQFCFCDRCRSRFTAERNIELPSGDAASQAATILEQHGDAWTAWRCGVIAGIIGRVRSLPSVSRRGLPLMINTLPFPDSDFDGQAVRRTVAAQDLALLAEHAQGFELMTYLQILNRPTSWMPAVLGSAWAELSGVESQVVCTLQVDALYTEGVHGVRQRSALVTADDLWEAGSTALEVGADGLVFYHWTDVLVDEARNGRKRAVLRAITGV